MLSESLLQLVRFNPDNTSEVAELRRQRILCGWAVELVETWCAAVRRGERILYWILPSDPSAFSLPEEEPLSLNPDEKGPPADPSFQPIGHVALDWVDHDGDESLADKDAGIIHLATFFVLKSQQGKGLGTIVMQEMEARAAKDLGAKVMTLTTIGKEHARDATWWAKHGYPYDPNVRSNETWYERYGYVAYKRNIPRYPGNHIGDDGKPTLMEAVFMRKELQ
ncbi:hypothetical protein JCM10213_007625 [Rhodosporidiobolus nylandii]